MVIILASAKNLNKAVIPKNDRNDSVKNPTKEKFLFPFIKRFIVFNSRWACLFACILNVATLKLIVF